MEKGRPAPLDVLQLPCLACGTPLDLPLKRRGRVIVYRGTCPACGNSSGVRGLIEAEMPVPVEEPRKWEVVWVQMLLAMGGYPVEPEVLEGNLTEAEAIAAEARWKINLAGAGGVHVTKRVAPNWLAGLDKEKAEG